MQFSLRAVCTFSLMGVLAWAHQSCNTVGVAEMFMSPDSDENGRHWVSFPPASSSINCIARVATGRKDITMVEKIVQTQKVDASGNVVDIPATTVGYVSFRPEPGTKLSVQTLSITPKEDPATNEPYPFPKGGYRCELYSDDGSGGKSYGTTPLSSTSFIIDYAECPYEGVQTGDPCVDIYAKGAAGKCRVAGTTDTSKLCTCNGTKKSWDCPAAAEDGIATVIIGGGRAKDAGTATVTTTTTDAGG